MWPMDTPNAPSPTRWSALMSGPEAAHAYRKRFLDLEATGEDIHGEARFITELVPPPSRVLDAGCGFGRVASKLTRLGHTAIGVDADEHLIALASRGPRHPVLRRRPVDPAPAHRAGVPRRRHGGQRRAVPRRRHPARPCSSGCRPPGAGRLPRLRVRARGMQYPTAPLRSTCGPTTGWPRRSGCRSSPATPRGTSTPFLPSSTYAVSVHRRTRG